MFHIPSHTSLCGVPELLDALELPSVPERLGGGLVPIRLIPLELKIQVRMIGNKAKRTILLVDCLRRLLFTQSAVRISNRFPQMTAQPSTYCTVQSKYLGKAKNG